MGSSNVMLKLNLIALFHLYVCINYWFHCFRLVDSTCLFSISKSYIQSFRLKGPHTCYPIPWWFFCCTPLNLTVERVDIDTILRAYHFIGHIKKSEAIQRLPFKRLIFGCLIERPLLHENKYQPNVEYKKQTKSEIISQAYWLWVCCELIGCFMRPNVFI